MARNQWPLEMAPAPMLPNGMGQNALANYLGLWSMPGSSSQIPDAAPVWPTPQSSPDFNDPDNWLGNTRNALSRQKYGSNLLAFLSQLRGGY
jgi:hypothetical protein